MEWFGVHAAMSRPMRADVGFHSAEFRTPTIDALAADGILLDQYYVQVFSVSDCLSFRTISSAYLLSNTSCAHGIQV